MSQGRTSSKIVYGKYLVTDAENVIPSGALYLEADEIVDVGSYADIAEKHSADEVLGSSAFLVTPGFVNAHGHGKGITDFQRGAIDDTLETWKFRRYPHIDRYYDTMWGAIKLLKSGVTTTMHNHTDLADPDAYCDEFSATIQAYLDSGIRLAFAPSVVNQNLFVYGDNQTFISSLSAPLQRWANGITRKVERFGEGAYFEAVEELWAAFSSSRVRIMHGPLAPQWVTDDVLKEIKRQAQVRDMRIHIHVLQTQLQKLYGRRRYGKSLLEHLYDLDFLGEDVTCGHCVWISEEDVELLGETGTSVTHHPSCNLRVRNGISPVFALLDHGVTVGIGMDDKELADDKDFIAEMRMVSKLHRLPSHQLDSEHLLPADCFRMGTEYGSMVLGFSSLVGTLEVGKKADVVLLDMTRMEEPFVYAGHNPIDLLIYRGRASDVDTVLVGGEVLLRGGELTTIDEREVIGKLRESISENYDDEFARFRGLNAGLREEIAAYFAPWYAEMDDIEKAPYYFVNNGH